MLKILAIDYGTKNIGLALSHGFLAEPYKVISNDEKMFENIESICKKENVGLIIVGLSENKMLTKTKKFAQRLEKKLDLAVEYVDETLSSQEARKKMTQAHLKDKKKKQPIDHYAASIFLQDWLDVQQSFSANTCQHCPHRTSCTSANSQGE